AGDAGRAGLAAVPVAVGRARRPARLSPGGRDLLPDRLAQPEGLRQGGHGRGRHQARRDDGRLSRLEGGAGRHLRGGAGRGGRRRAAAHARAPALRPASRLRPIPGPGGRRRGAVGSPLPELVLRVGGVAERSEPAPPPSAPPPGADSTRARRDLTLALALAIVVAAVSVGLLALAYLRPGGRGLVSDSALLALLLANVIVGLLLIG